MTQERLTVRKIKEILRLKWESRLSNRAIARACNLSSSTVSEYIQRATRAGLSWPLPEGLGDEELNHKLFPQAVQASELQKTLPDWEQVHRELRKRGVTLKLLWTEYCEQFPGVVGYTQYCEHYRRWSRQLSPSMRLPHKGGEELEVDYAGMTLSIVNSETGEVTQAQIFVATLAASSYTYAEAQSSQTLPNWIGGHVRAFAFFGGLPRLLKPDNLKAGVKSPCYYEPDINPTYQKMAEYYGVGVLPTRVRKPKDYPEDLQIPNYLLSAHSGTNLSNNPSPKSFSRLFRGHFRIGNTFLCRNDRKKVRDNIFSSLLPIYPIMITGISLIKNMEVSVWAKYHYRNSLSGRKIPSVHLSIASQRYISTS